MIEILNSNLKRIDILRRYSFAQYTEKFRDVGTFELHIPMSDEMKYLFDETEQYYFLFDTKYHSTDKKILGVLDKISKASSDSSDYDNEVTITGRMSQFIFKQRIVNGTVTFQGYSFLYLQELMKKNISGVDSSDPRYLNLAYSYFPTPPKIYQKTSQVSKQVTGGYLWDAFEEVMEQDKLGIFMFPYLTQDSEIQDVKYIETILSVGSDRRVGNKDGNVEVVFSQDISNLARTSYERNTEQYMNHCYIAGEGEKENRKWFDYDINSDVQLLNKNGFNRRELWIDARDIQSEQDNKILTDAEYEVLIKQRVSQNAVENTEQKSYEATLTEQTKQYKFGVDYNLGDWCTILDTEYGLKIDVQILEATHTLQSNQEIVDISFGYGIKQKLNIMEQMKDQSTKISHAESNIAYLESEIEKLKK